MGQADVWLDDDVSVCDVQDYTLQSGDVTVHITNRGWWRVIEALQEWLGECPHCGKLVGEKANLAEGEAKAAQV